MKKLNQAIMRVEQAVGSVMLIAVVLLVFLSAIVRLTPNINMIWSVDASQLMFIWISMLGADLALKKHSHMGVDILVKRFPDRMQKILSLGAYLLCAAFSLFVTYWGVLLCIKNALRSYQTLKISYSFATAAVPVLSILMLLTLAEQILDLLKHWKEPIVKDESIEGLEEDAIK